MKRGRFKILVDILTAIQEHPNYTKTRLMGPANIDGLRLAKFLNHLNHKGFIEFVSLKRKGSTKPILTEQGRDWLRRAKALLEEIK